MKEGRMLENWEPGMVHKALGFVKMIVKILATKLSSLHQEVIKEKKEKNESMKINTTQSIKRI